MKQLFYLTLVCCLFSCAPRFNYLGETEAPTTKVDLYYDAGDIEKDYKVLGLLSVSNKETLYSLERLKESIIENAKKKGADALLFLNLVSNNEDALHGTTHYIEAKLLKYR